MRRNARESSSDNPAPDQTEPPDDSALVAGMGGGFLGGGASASTSLAGGVPAAHEPDLADAELSGETTQYSIATASFPLADYPDYHMDNLFREFVQARRLRARLPVGERTPPSGPTYDSTNWGFRSFPDQPILSGVGGPADISALERSWAVLPPSNPTSNIDTWDTNLTPLPVAANAELRSDSMCVVCCERQAEMVLTPCWHLVLCPVWLDSHIPGILSSNETGRFVVGRSGSERRVRGCDVPCVE